MTGGIRKSEWDRLRAEARARGEYPPLIDYFTVSDAEPDAVRPLGLLGRLGEFVGIRADPEPEIEAEL
jgi:hypothetical protein